VVKRPRKIDRGSRDWYQLGRWRHLAKHQLKIEPLCAFCLAKGRATPATIADHVQPHEGDWNQFVLGRLQSLCAPCHSGPKQRQDRGWTKPVYGPDGWPIALK